MKSWMAILFSALVASASVPQRAEACGVKLTIKGSGHRKGVARTSNPSDVLLLGSPPRRLSRDLSSAGHRVEVAPSPSAAKRKSYAVVITENQQADEARQTFPGSVILVRSGDVVSDMRSVEKQVARKPVKGSDPRDPVAVREERPVVAAGPIQPKREIVTAAETKEVEPAKPVETKPIESKPAPTPVASKETPKETPKPVASKETPKPAPTEVAAANPPAKPTAVTPKTVSRSGSEVYFGLNQDEAKTASLKKVVAWLSGSPDVQVVVEGHADPSGNPDSNMALSQRRAEWVRDALVAAGIDSSRIEVKSFGSTTLKYGTTDGRNRRVVVVAK